MTQLEQPERLTVLPEHLPDAVSDTELYRAKWFKRYGVSLTEKLERAADGRTLYHLIIPVGTGGAADLYDPAVKELTQDIARSIVGKKGVAYAKMELGTESAVHLHLATTATLPAGTEGEQRDVYKLSGLVKYLGSKPGDARAAMVKTICADGRERYRQNTEQNRLDALNDYLLARWQVEQAGGGQLPRLAWTHNLPR